MEYWKIGKKACVSGFRSGTGTQTEPRTCSSPSPTCWLVSTVFDSLFVSSCSAARLLLFSYRFPCKTRTHKANRAPECSDDAWIGALIGSERPHGEPKSMHWLQLRPFLMRISVIISREQFLGSSLIRNCSLGDKNAQDMLASPTPIFLPRF